MEDFPYKELINSLQVRFKIFSHILIILSTLFNLLPLLTSYVTCQNLSERLIFTLACSSSAILQNQGTAMRSSYKLPVTQLEQHDNYPKNDSEQHYHRAARLMTAHLSVQASAHMCITAADVLH